MLPNNWRYLRGDIYYADMEPHIGSEQGGKRPVVVLQNNIGDQFMFGPAFMVSPVTVTETAAVRCTSRSRKAGMISIQGNIRKAE